MGLRLILTQQIIRIIFILANDGMILPPIILQLMIILAGLRVQVIREGSDLNLIALSTTDDDELQIQVAAAFSRLAAGHGPRLDSLEPIFSFFCQPPSPWSLILVWAQG